ncbi:MAG: class I SAM-dependent methyltransferase [Candidatus Hodarchaeota archaeon]
MFELRYFSNNGIEVKEHHKVSEDEFWEGVKNDPNYLFFQDRNEKGENITIKIPRGSWDIMEAIANKILKYQPGDIIEIGMGESSEIFAQMAQQWGVRLYSCDVQMGGMFKVFEQPLFLNHTCFIGKSENFIKEYDGFPAIVFLDGEHRYGVVKKEVDFFLPRILPGGVMFLHDTFPEFRHQIETDSKGWSPGDVYKIRQELERNPNVDVLTFPYSANNMGLTMIMKHGDRPEYWLKNGRAVDES